MAAGDKHNSNAFATMVERSDGSMAMQVVIYDSFSSLDETNSAGNVEVSTAKTTKTATIAIGGEYTGEIDLEGYQLVAIKMPADWNPASLNLFASDATGGTFYPVYDTSGSAVSLTVAEDRVVVPTAAIAAALAPLRFIKFQSSVTQDANRTLTLILKG